MSIDYDLHRRTRSGINHIIMESIKSVESYPTLPCPAPYGTKSMVVLQISFTQLGNSFASSFLYETPPMYVKDQPWFLNAACRLDTELSPIALLERLKALEAAIGR